jgi:starch phosphorylase
MALADFADYQKTQQAVSKAYADKEKFAKISLMNISGAGVFSADRSIMDYANNIWHAKPVNFEKNNETVAKKETSNKKKLRRK